MSAASEKVPTLVSGCRSNSERLYPVSGSSTLMNASAV